MNTNIVLGRRFRRSTAKRSGFVLVMTLVLIVIVAITTVSLARVSLQRAIMAVDAQAELEHEWAAKSCRLVLLDGADELFEGLERQHLEDERDWPSPRTFGDVFVLNGVQYRVLLSDENAKVNINSLNKKLPNQAEAIVRHLVDNTGDLPLLGLPAALEEAEKEDHSIGSWGEVFRMEEIFQAGQVDAFLSATEHVTCWGNGRVNVRRIGDRALLEIGKELADPSAAIDLVDFRRNATEPDSRQLRQSMAGVRDNKLPRWFADTSSCYSLWIEVDDGKQKWYHLGIVGGSSEQNPADKFSFHW